MLPKTRRFASLHAVVLLATSILVGCGSDAVVLPPGGAVDTLPDGMGGIYVLDPLTRERGGPFGPWKGLFDAEGRLLDPGLVTLDEGVLGEGVVRTDVQLRAVDSLSLPGLDRPTFPPVRGAVRTGRSPAAGGSCRR